MKARAFRRSGPPTQPNPALLTEVEASSSCGRILGRYSCEGIPSDNSLASMSFHYTHPRDNIAQHYPTVPQRALIMSRSLRSLTSGPRSKIGRKTMTRNGKLCCRSVIHHVLFLISSRLEISLRSASHSVSVIVNAHFSSNVLVTCIRIPSLMLAVYNHSLYIHHKYLHERVAAAVRLSEDRYDITNCDITSVSNTASDI